MNEMPRLNLTIEDILDIIEYLKQYASTLGADDRKEVIELIHKLKEISL